MGNTFKGMLIFALFLLGIAFYQGGMENFLQGLNRGLTMLFNLFPLLIIAFLVAGLISNLIPRELISRWLGKEAGWKGPLLGAIAGALVPGGPFFFYPLLATFLVSGAEIGTLISFVAAKTTWSLGRLPLEMAIVGVEITLIRLVVTFIFPVLLGLFVNTFLGGWTEKIRRDVKNLREAREGGGQDA